MCFLARHWSSDFPLVGLVSAVFFLIHFWAQCAINQSMLILVEVREKTALASGHRSIKSVTEGKTLDIFSSWIGAGS